MAGQGEAERRARQAACAALAEQPRPLAPSFAKSAPTSPRCPARRCVCARAQESSSYMPAVRPERRREALNEMVAARRQALSILTQCLASAQGNERTQKQVCATWEGGPQGAAGGCWAARLGRGRG